MKILLAFILILALFFIVVMVIDCNRFVIREYRCEDKRLKKPLKIVQLSDLHNKSFLLWQPLFPGHTSTV